jgi:hypothetical protein
VIDESSRLLMEKFDAIPHQLHHSFLRLTVSLNVSLGRLKVRVAG